KPFSFNPFVIVGPALLMLFIFSVWPNLMQIFAADQIDTALPVAAELDAALKVLLPIAGLLVMGGVMFNFMKESDRNEQLNAKVYPKLIERYHALYYCAHCSLIYDVTGNSAIASEDGFNRMLSRGSNVNL